MACVVEIFRGSKIKESGVDFSLHYHVWDYLLEEAQKEGWDPMGTEKPFDQKFDNFVNDYRPSYPASKVITSKDASHFAEALKKIMDKSFRDQTIIHLHGPTIIRESTWEHDAGVFYTKISLEFMSDFIAYLEEGECEFWWDAD
jgi:hypothetical protein